MPEEMAGVPRKVLVIEDDRNIAHLLEVHLGDLGCEVTLAFDGKQGLEAALQGEWDVIILDIMLPEMDGLEVCREIRAKTAHVPILMLTARSTEMDKVLGLEIGADDYLTKPFSMRELQARVKALFRRMVVLQSRGASQLPETITAGDLSISTLKRQVAKAGKAVRLTAKEFDLLVHLASHPGRVYTRSELLDEVWHYSFQGYEHTVNSHINRLRAKIEDDPARPAYVLTVWGVGYKFVDADADVKG